MPKHSSSGEKSKDKNKARVCDGSNAVDNDTNNKNSKKSDEKSTSKSGKGTDRVTRSKDKSSGSKNSNDSRSGNGSGNTQSKNNLDGTLQSEGHQEDQLDYEDDTVDQNNETRDAIPKASNAKGKRDTKGSAGRESVNNSQSTTSDEKSEGQYSPQASTSQKEYVSRSPSSTDSSTDTSSESESSESSYSSQRKRKKIRKSRKASKKYKKQRARKRRREQSESSEDSESEAEFARKRSAHKRSKRKLRSKDRSVKSKRKRSYQRDSSDTDGAPISKKDLMQYFEDFYKSKQEHTAQSMCDGNNTTATSRDERTQGSNKGKHNSSIDIDEIVQRRLDQIRLEPHKSETTIYSRFCKRNTAVESQYEDRDVSIPINVMKSPTGLIGPKVSSDSDNILNSHNNSSDDGISFVENAAVNEHMETIPQAEHNRVSDKVERIVTDAELNKTQMLKPPGNNPPNFNRPVNVIDTIPRSKDLDRCDELKHHVSAHIDSVTRVQIERGEFIELERLAPKSKGNSGDRQLRLTNKDGNMYYIPSVEDADASGLITGFRSWQRHFRIYQDIYSSANPTKASQLIQYCNTIEMYSSLYTWENVAKYDRLVRQLMAEFPHRDWGKIYDIAKQGELKDSLAIKNILGTFKKGSNSKRKNKACWRFNKFGKCHFGANCYDDHRCASCGQQGHGKNSCQRKERPQKDKKDSDRIDKSRSTESIN